MKNIVLLLVIFLLLIMTSALAADSTKVFRFEYDDTELSAIIIRPLPLIAWETILFNVMEVNAYQMTVDGFTAIGISYKKYEALDSVIVHRLDFKSHSAFTKKYAETYYIYVIGWLKESGKIKK